MNPSDKRLLPRKGKFNPWRELNGVSLDLYCKEKALIDELKKQYRRSKRNVSFSEWLLLD
jgi:hypothetical protein